ncbi:hypothetical protein GGTG_12120 [Gaeumannomyces tritici R3-111a-1]|uniref:Uncharacterized protein n=1 Tax=Gaeumannomyces tritici (strain R3-111a-1) TaxID=644352 RepID=J3PF41_GAET3|nr:hypothetical protein GGTG_12120 [Gaeumannomyces tritici R3-111a-1]EJT71099.1 hypothetical protein GGTG_12120 [Gaeumannomyces tritici R3-111a-1]
MSQYPPPQQYPPQAYGTPPPPGAYASPPPPQGYPPPQQPMGYYPPQQAPPPPAEEPKKDRGCLYGCTDSTRSSYVTPLLAVYLTHLLQGTLEPFNDQPSILLSSTSSPPKSLQVTISDAEQEISAVSSATISASQIPFAGAGASLAMMRPFGFPLTRHPRPVSHPPPVVDSPQDDPGVGASTTPTMPGSFPESVTVSAPHRPSVLDVVVAKAMMVKALTLPLELVNRIMDFAEYWPHTSAQLDYGAAPRAVARGSSPQEDVFLASKTRGPSSLPSHQYLRCLTDHVPLPSFPAAHCSPRLV